MVEQLSIFLENETGGLADVADVLARAGVDLRALSLADETDFGILRLIVNDADRAAAVLKEAGFTVRKTPVVLVEIPDRPGGLAEYMYAFVRKAGENALVVFRFEDPAAAVETLRKAGARLLAAEDVRKL